MSVVSLTYPYGTVFFPTVRTHRMASSIDSVGKRCAAVEQGHHELEAHFVNFMSGTPGSNQTHRKRFPKKKGKRDTFEVPKNGGLAEKTR